MMGCLLRAQLFTVIHEYIFCSCVPGMCSREHLLPIPAVSTGSPGFYTRVYQVDVTMLLMYTVASESQCQGHEHCVQTWQPRRHAPLALNRYKPALRYSLPVTATHTRMHASMHAYSASLPTSTSSPHTCVRYACLPTSDSEGEGVPQEAMHVPSARSSDTAPRPNTKALWCVQSYTQLKKVPCIPRPWAYMLQRKP